MRDRQLVVIVVGAVSLLVASGCTLGPDPERPVTAADQAERFVNAPQEAVAESPPGGPWWQRFGDEATAELVEMALENNTDLQAAAARVLEAEALLRRSKGAQWPQLSVGLSGNRSKSSFVLPSVGRIGIFSTTYAEDLSVSYQVDLFGKLRRSKQAAWADALAQEAAREVVLHSVVSAVVRARVQVATLERALAITRNIRSSWESTLGTVERRYRMGVARALELRLARENLASARAAEVQLAGSVAPARHALDVLVGRRPGTGDPLPGTLSTLPDLEPVPSGLPAALLDRRPDLRQAEMNLSAATSRIGVALADLYPSLSLTGSTGVRSDTLNELTSAEGLIYNLAANLVAPIFAGGQLRAGVAAARARADQAAALYAGTVLNALREVEDALVMNETNRERLGLTEERVAEARAADRLARDRYQRGVETLITVLDTERRLRLAEEALITAQSDMWNSRIDLFLALGGDWDPPPEQLKVEPSQPTAQLKVEGYSRPTGAVTPRDERVALRPPTALFDPLAKSHKPLPSVSFRPPTHADVERSHPPTHASPKGEGAGNVQRSTFNLQPSGEGGGNVQRSTFNVQLPGAGGGNLQPSTFNLQPGGKGGGSPPPSTFNLQPTPEVPHE